MNRRNTIGLAAALAAVLGIGAAITAAATIHVPGDYPTIQAAIDAAVAGDEVVVAPGTYYENINFLGKAITVRSSGGALVTTIDGQDLGHSVRMTTGETTASVLRGFRVTGGGVFAEWCSPTIEQCTFAGISGQYAPSLWLRSTSAQVSDCTFWNNTGYDGGAITVFGGDVIGTPRLDRCTFQGNYAQNYGGAIHAGDANCRVQISGCQFTGNGAQHEGGAVQLVRGSQATFQGCTFIGNSAGWGGGALQITGQSSPTLTECYFAENTAPNNGGSVIVWDSSLASLANCTFTYNSASVGGALYLTNQSQSTFHDCVFLNNFATYSGGAVYADWAALSAFYNVIFSSNNAPSAGAVFVGGDDTSLLIEDCTFEDNGTPVYGLGGAIRVGWGGHASITGSTFTSNRADGGGAICVNDNSILTIDQSTFSGNTADWDGGALKIAWNAAHATVTHCAFSGNHAVENAGGAVNCHSGGGFMASNCTFVANHASDGGAVSLQDGASGTLTNSHFELNTAANEGGAVIYRWSDAALLVDGCVFRQNSAQLHGGAFVTYQTFEGSSITLSHCDFVKNNALYGGALKVQSAAGTVKLLGSRFAENSSTEYGGAINWADQISDGTIANCTVANNAVSSGMAWGGAIACASPVTITNSVLYGNLVGGNPGQIGGWVLPTVDYSDIQGGYPGEGNIDADPVFYDPENGDYRPAAGSPCIDAGSNALVPPDLTTDIDGWPRIVDGNADGTATVDMGAYEAQDCNGNAVPDFQDIAQGTSADLNENQIPDDCEDQTCTNLSTGQTYPTIAAAITAAQNGHHLRAAALAYTITPTIDFAGKQVLLDSSGEIVQPTVGLINMTNNADLATAPGRSLTVRGTLRSANNATADVAAGNFAVVEDATLRARLGSTLSVETTAGSTLGGTTYVEANATLNFTGPVTNTAGVTTVTNATFSAMDAFINTGTFSTLQSNVILAAATNAGTMNLPNVSLLADELINAQTGQLTGHGQLYTNLANAGNLAIVNNTTIVGNVLNQTTGLIVLQLGTTTLVGTLTNDGGLVGQFGGRGGALDIVGNFIAGPAATLSLPAGSRISVTGNYDVAINDPSRYALTAAALQLRGAARTQYLEVMSRDRGSSPDGLDPELPGSFPLGTLHIGPSAAIVQLVDNHDNDGLGQAACEAIYADTVLIDAAATLNNPVCKIYYNTLVNQGSVTHPEHLVQIREHIPGDLNGDGVVNLSDLAQLLAHYGMTSGATYEMGDIDGDGDVDLSDLAALLGNYGMGA